MIGGEKMDEERDLVPSSVTMAEDGSGGRCAAAYCRSYQHRRTEKVSCFCPRHPDGEKNVLRVLPVSSQMF